MTWLTWRQHRWEATLALLVLFVLGVGVVLLTVAGSGLLAEISRNCQQTSQLVVATTCGSLPNQYSSSYQSAWWWVAAAGTVIPALAGVFVGAPLVARELESGTHLLIWSQGITRRRWFLGGLGLLVLGTVSSTALLAAASQGWFGMQRGLGLAGSSEPVGRLRDRPPCADRIHPFRACSRGGRWRTDPPNGAGDRRHLGRLHCRPNRRGAAGSSALFVAPCGARQPGGSVGLQLRNERPESLLRLVSGFYRSRRWRGSSNSERGILSGTGPRLLSPDLRDPALPAGGAVLALPGDRGGDLRRVGARALRAGLPAGDAYAVADPRRRSARVLRQPTSHVTRRPFRRSQRMVIRPTWVVSVAMAGGGRECR